jgi:hypothetical protein
MKSDIHIEVHLRQSGGLWAPVGSKEGLQGVIPDIWDTRKGSKKELGVVENTPSLDFRILKNES